MRTQQTNVKKSLYNFKSGLDLQALDARLSFLKENSKDYVTPVGNLSMTDDNKISFVNGRKHELNLNSLSHGQLATFAGVPKNFYDEIKAENPKLLAQVVNHRFDVYKKEKRMVRTINNDVRAILGDSYRVLDCADLFHAALEPMQKSGLKIVSSELTERRMYIKALSPTLKTEIKKGDVVQYGIVISSSDVGEGSLRVEPMVMRLVCLNGAISSTALKKYHKGSRHELGDSVAEILTKQTNDAKNKAFWLEIRDIIQSSLSPKFFQNEIEKMKHASINEITNTDLPEVIEITAKTVGISLTDDRKKSLLYALSSGNEGAGLTQWGLANSFTRMAQLDSVDYDQAISFERAGGEIISLNEKAWARINA